MNWLVRLIEWYLDKLEIQRAEREEEQRRRILRQIRLKQNALVQTTRPLPIPMKEQKVQPKTNEVQTESLDRFFDSLSKAPEQNNHQNSNVNVPVTAGYVQVHYKVYQGNNKWQDETTWLTENGEVAAQNVATPLMLAQPATEFDGNKSKTAIMTAPPTSARRKWARHWQSRKRRF